MGRDGMLGAFEEMVLLAVVRESGTGYGMTIRRMIEDRTGRDVAIGAVYATLERLEKKKLIASELGDGDSSRRGRARRYFRVLPGGVEALDRTRSMRAGLWEGLDLRDVAEDAGRGR